MTFTQIDLLAKAVDKAYKNKKEFTDNSKKFLSLAKQLKTYSGWLKVPKLTKSAVLTKVAANWTPLSKYQPPPLVHR